MRRREPHASGCAPRAFRSRLGKLPPTATTSRDEGFEAPLVGNKDVRFNAAAASGIGNQTVTPSFKLAVRGNTYAGTYTSTWTLTLSTGP
jgi:hypothetical protein